MNGTNTIPEETYRRFSLAVLALYKLHAAGGPLHIVTDDNNVRNMDLAFCRGLLPKKECGCGGECNGSASVILDILEPLTFQERYWLVSHCSYGENLEVEIEHWYPKDGETR